MIVVCPTYFLSVLELFLIFLRVLGVKKRKLVGGSGKVIHEFLFEFHILLLLKGFMLLVSKDILSIEHYQLLRPLVCYHRLDETIQAIANGTLNQPLTKLDRSSEEPLGVLVNPNLYQSPPQVSGPLQ